MNFDDVIAFLESYTNLEKDPGLFNKRTYRISRMKTLLGIIGNPQNSYKTIHVAGSKGKGSVCAYISAALTASGEKTGLFMSPHVSDYRERFMINNCFASDREYISTAVKIKEKLEKTELKPTAFEMYTAFAFQLFKDTNCSYAVIETGLGGRLDATNTINPELSVLTTIEAEHTDILGNTLKEIATEKSKIIKYGKPVFTYNQDEDVLKVFSAEAERMHSDFFYLPDHINEIKEYQQLSENLAMKGGFQKNNFLLSMLVMKYLNRLTHKTALSASRITLPGRFEKTEYSNRVLILDGCHTENSIRDTVETFKKSVKHCKVCIFGCVSGKKIREMGEILIPEFEKIIITTPGTWKKSNISEIYSIFKNLNAAGRMIQLIPDNNTALEQALEYTDKNDSILLCGSFYLVGEFKKIIMKKDLQH